MKSLRIVFIISSTLFLSSCLTPSQYGPDPEPAPGHYGYSEVQGDSTWDVTFAANYQTPLQLADQYALYRYAELTVDKGFDYFVVLKTKNTSSQWQKKRDLSVTKTIQMYAGFEPKKKTKAVFAKQMLDTMAYSIDRSSN